MRRSRMLKTGLLFVALAAVTGCPLVGAPSLVVTPLAFDFPPNKAVDTFAILNGGPGTLTWEIEFDAAANPWLSVAPLTGSLTSAVQTVTMTVDHDLVPDGDAQTTITVTSNGGTQTVEVHAGEAEEVDPPTLDVQPLVLNLGASDTMGEFVVTNTGSGVLDWEVDTTKGIAFLTLDPLSGSLAEGQSQTVDVTLDRDALPAGMTTVDVPFTSNDGDVTAQVTASVQDLSVEPRILDYGLTDTTMTFTVTNTGVDPFNWSVDNLGSLPSFVTSVMPSSGTVAGGNFQQVQVDIDRSGLDAGSFETTLSIDSTGGSETVMLMLEVQGLNISPTSLDFGVGSDSELVTISNLGNTPFDWSASIPSEFIWLSVTPPSGTLEPGESETMRVDVDRAGLSPGLFEGVVNITSTEGDVVLPVSMNVPLPQPTLTVSPTEINFGSQQEERSLAVWNSGIGSIDYSIDTNTFPVWLSLTPTDPDGVARGTVSGDDTDLLSLTVDRFAAGMAGDFSFDLTVNGMSAGGAVTPVVVTVNMEVLALPIIDVTNEIRIPVDTVTGSFTIRNLPGATGDLEFNIDIANLDAPWLVSLEPSQGVLAPGQSATVTVTIDRSKLEDDLRFELPIMSNDPNANPILIIQIEVPPLPEIFVSTNSVDLTREESTEDFDVANIGDVDTLLHFRVEVDPVDRRWLFVNPPGGTSRRFASLILDRVPIFISINRAELDPEGDTGFAIGKLTIIPVEFPGGPDISADIIEREEVVVSVAPSPLTFETAQARTRIPSLVRWVLMMRDLKAQSIPFELTINDIDGAEDNNGDGIADLIQDGAVTFSELQIVVPDITQDQFDSIDRNGDGAIDGADVALAQGDEIGELLLEHFTPKFQIFENGAPAEIAESSQFLTSGSRAKSDVIILLDYSNSMNLSAFEAQAAYAELVAAGEAIDNPIFNGFEASPDPLQFLYEVCVSQLIMELPSTYRVALLEFHDRLETALGDTRVVQGLTRLTDVGRASLLASLDAIAIPIEDRGASEVFLATLDAALLLLNQDANLFLEAFDTADFRGIVTISDGRETTPPLELNETILAIRETNVQIFPISWGSEPNNAALATMAIDTGGHHYPAFESILESVDADGELVVEEVPNPDELFDWCFTATDAINNDRNDPFNCDQSVAKDFDSQFVLSYVSLNEQSNAQVRVGAIFDDPNDNLDVCLRDQRSIEGSYTQALVFEEVVGVVRMGQISLATDGVTNNKGGTTAEVVVRAEYVPRAVDRFQFTFNPVPDNVEVIPFVEGGLVHDWTLQNFGGGTFRLDPPAGDGPLQYADFGNMLRLTYNNPAPFTLLVTVDNTIYDAPPFDKFFMYPDSIPVMAETPFFAPAFPTPRFTCIANCTQANIGADILLNIGANATAQLAVQNVGGNYPYPNAFSFINHVFLHYLILEPGTVSVTPFEGILNTTLAQDILTFTPDRDIRSGLQEAEVIFDYDAGSLNVVGSVDIIVLWDVLPPAFAINPTTFDITPGMPEIFMTTLSNTGESTLTFQVLNADLLPDWIQLSTLAGALSFSSSTRTLQITFDDTDAIAPVQDTTIFIQATDVFTGQVIDTIGIDLNAP